MTDKPTAAPSETALEAAIAAVERDYLMVDPDHDYEEIDDNLAAVVIAAREAAALSQQLEQLKQEAELLREDAERWRSRCIEAPYGLLVSIAMRLDHSFLMGPMLSESHEQWNRRREMVLADAKRALEEISGKGFWSPENNADYES